MAMPSFCKILVKNGVAFLTMPDGTIIPQQVSLKINDTVEEAMKVRSTVLVEVDIDLYAEWSDTIIEPKRLEVESTDKSEQRS